MTSEDDKNTSYDSHPEVSDQSEGEEELDSKYRDAAGDQEIPGEKLENDEDLLDDVPKDADDLDLSHLKIRSLSALDMKRLPKLKVATFRQNLISSCSGLEDLPTDLEELTLYDNRISHIRSHLDHFTTSMHTLDFSFNKLKHIKHFDHLTGLTTLYLCQNNISRIEGLETLVNLTSLELGANKIREIKNLDKLVNLEELWLGKNKITKLENLSTLKKLKILSIQSNRITKLENLEELESLEQLYISHNGIKAIEGLDKNTKLDTIDVSSNFIEELSGLSHLENLEELWASGNKLQDFRNIEKQLAHLPKLHTVYFEMNPLQFENKVTYRNKVRLSLGSSLQQIDATFIR